MRTDNTVSQSCFQVESLPGHHFNCVKVTQNNKEAELKDKYVLNKISYYSLTT